MKKKTGADCFFLAVILLLFGGITVCGEEKQKAQDLGSVVKIFAVVSNPDYYQPWQNFQQMSKTGSGFVIDGNRILTNAHIVANQTFLMVRKQGDAEKYVARLEAVGHECDLAILRVDNPAFFKNMPPLQLGELPDLQDTVSVFGYPVGGDNISITEGVISRIEPIIYSHSGRRLLAVQIDAAINPGNSGGPVIDKGKVVGVAFQGLSTAQSIGYMIPVTVIRHFLKDVADGKFDGFPNYNFEVMRMENPDIRTWAGMKPEQSGVMISFLPPLEKTRGPFKVNDVVMAIDEIRIANDATVPFRKKEVVFFGNIIWEKYIGETCKVKILRQGKELVVDYKLAKPEQLVPERDFDKNPTYFVIGGMVLVPLSINYLDTWGEWWKGPPFLVDCVTRGEITEQRNQVVVLSMVLADSVNVGYQDVRFQAVEKVNGKTLKNLQQLVDIIENTKSGFIELELDNYMKIVFDVNKFRQATATILKRYRIPADRSVELVK